MRPTEESSHTTFADGAQWTADGRAGERTQVPILSRRTSFVTVIALAAAASGFAILIHSTLPYFHFGFYLALAAVFAVALVIMVPAGSVQHGLLTVASLLATLAALEIATTIYTELVDIYLDPDRPRYNGDARRFVREHPELGFEPQEASTQVHARRIKDGRIVYDVRYSIDEQRHRPTDGNKPASCTILFFGDSFVFGMGVDDKDTLPNQLLAHMQGRCNGVNYGLQAYGPHHTLLMLETVPPARMGSGCVAAVVTTLLPDHGRRARGLYYWARFAPRYELVADERVEAAGRIDRFSGRFTSWAAFRRELIGVLRGSALFDRLYQYPELEDADEVRYTDALLVALITQAAGIVWERFHVPLTVIAWDDENGSLKPVLARLRERGVDAVDKDALLAGPWTPDYLIAGDGHPSAKANGEIAASLARRFAGCR